MIIRNVKDTNNMKNILKISCFCTLLVMLAAAIVITGSHSDAHASTNSNQPKVIGYEYPMPSEEHEGKTYYERCKIDFRDCKDQGEWEVNVNLINPDGDTYGPSLPGEDRYQQHKVTVYCGKSFWGGYKVSIDDSCPQNDEGIYGTVHFKYGEFDQDFETDIIDWSVSEGCPMAIDYIEIHAVRCV